MKRVAKLIACFHVGAHPIFRSLNKIILHVALLFIKILNRTESAIFVLVK